MIDTKIKSLSELRKITAKLKSQNKTIVLTNGCFDLLHYGHVRYLEVAKTKGDILIVAINSDSSVRKIKGADRPIVKEKDRLSLAAALESVDYVLLFNEKTPLRLIKELKPDILAKGADWKKDKIIGGDFVSSYGGKVSTIKLQKGRSTSGIINKIVKIFK